MLLVVVVAVRFLDAAAVVGGGAAADLVVGLFDGHVVVAGEYSVTIVAAADSR